MANKKNKNNLNNKNKNKNDLNNHTNNNKPKTNQNNKTINHIDTEGYHEYVHYCDVIETFQFYIHEIDLLLNKKSSDYKCLSEEYKLIFFEFEDRIKELRKLAKENQNFLLSVADYATRNFRLDLKDKFDTKEFWQSRIRRLPSKQNIDKIFSTIKQCVRDWGDEGQSERDKSYEIVLKELEKHFPEVNRRKDIKVLNPGCGLARLTWEIARRGFFSQGNEFSYFMLFTSNFILNRCDKKSQKIYPYISSFKNNINYAHKIRKTLIPNVNIENMPSTARMSMVAGDFLEIYSDPSQYGTWDAIVSVFFIDTAHNVLQYLKIISLLLKPGGIFINFGPLLYHYENNCTEFSIEMSLDDIKKKLPEFGLELIKEKRKISVGYCDNILSMQRNQYDCALWVCRKKENFIINKTNLKKYDEKFRVGGVDVMPKYYKNK